MDPVARLLDRQVDAIRRALQEADYTADAVMARIGPAGQAGLQRNSTFAAADALSGATDALATLIRLFVLQQPLEPKQIAAALPVADPAVAAALLDADGQRARVDVRPYASDDGLGAWIVSDLVSTLDTASEPARPDFVLGVSPASMTLAQLAIRQPIGSALDLGTGCGVQSLHLARHADRVVATDVNGRALDLASLTFRLNQVDVDLRDGSLYAPVLRERFDLILTNPPYVMSPPGPQRHRLTYRDAGLPGDDLVRRVVSEAPRHLAENGVLQVLGNWAHVAGQDWRERVVGWVGTGCDALILQREVLDVYEYVELWLADAGIAGTPQYEARYREWIDYFAGLGIEGVGLGWILVRNSGNAVPHVVAEDWPHAVAHPVSAGFSEFVAAADLARLGDDEVLAGRWRLAVDAVQETLGRPGAEDPEHVVLRRQTGFRRAVEVDSALGGVLGACDGDLPLDGLLAAVAQILERDPADVRRQVLPRFRELIAQGWLSRSANPD